MAIYIKFDKSVEDVRCVFGKLCEQNQMTYKLPWRLAFQLGNWGQHMNYLPYLKRKPTTFTMSLTDEPLRNLQTPAWIGPAFLLSPWQSRNC